MVNFPQKLEISEVVAEILMDATDWHRLYVIYPLPLNDFQNQPGILGEANSFG
jgi:hypothetical protein